MGQHVDTDAQLAQLLALLVDLARDARPLQQQSGRQTADSGSHHDGLHAGRP
jgi:hypothetical protein